MTDDLETHLLVAHLRSIDQMSVEDCFCQSPYYIKAAYRLEQLMAERDKYEVAWMTAEGKLADAEAMIEAQAKDHASNNIRFAEATHRAKFLNQEVKNLKKLVFEAYCEGFQDGKDGGWIVGPSNQPWKGSDVYKALVRMETKND